ncbi:MAG: hypothetical protein KJ058_05465 [Thermoanaerobaculia bacterium]|nr:hypothetical protein [Thermoanaerobaculia bacterium]MCZ7650287.1 hypothetical protein [Thermoanaerobaculia bacterium]
MRESLTRRLLSPGERGNAHPLGESPRAGAGDRLPICHPDFRDELRAPARRRNLP